MPRKSAGYSQAEASAAHIDRAAKTPVKPTGMDNDTVLGAHILGGIYPAEAAEIARATRYVRRTCPDDAAELLDALGLTEAG